MTKSISKITINAPAEKVWNALTNPSLVKQWQYGSKLLTDWKVGSEIRFQNEWEDKIYEQWGKVLEVEQCKLIKYSLFAPRPGLEDKPENYFVMSYILNVLGDATYLTIEQEDNRQEADEDKDYDDDEQSILYALKRLAEAQ